MILEQKRQEQIAKNLAGVDLPGYKRAYTVSSSFEDTFKNQKETPGNLKGVDSGVEMVDMTQGMIRATNRKLDFAIEGKAFFEVEGPNGQRLLTRNGAFHLNGAGVLTTSEGYKVGGNIQFNPTHNLNTIQVTPAGKITVLDGGIITEIGSLQLTEVKNDQDLERLSASYFTAKGNRRSTATEGSYIVRGGCLEMANHSPIKTMTEMIQSQREFEMDQKVLKMLEDRFRQEMMKMGV